jgi:hypothetical protein
MSRSSEPDAELRRGQWTPEPRWPAVIAVIAVGGLSVALPPGLTIGPRWLFPAVIGVFLVPTIVTHWAGWAA